MIDDDPDGQTQYDEDEAARIAALHKTAPERIWLQIDPEAEQFDGWDAQTWCSDRINDSDLEYMRVDLAESLCRQRDELLAALEYLKLHKLWINSHAKAVIESVIAM